MRFVRFVIPVALVACGDKPIDPKPDAAEVVQLVAHDVSQPLRDYAKIAMARPKVRDADRIEAEPARRIPLPHMKYDNGVSDPVVQSAHVATPAIPTPTVNFEGVGAGLPGFQVQFFPPDTDGDIGDNDYVQVVNTSLAIFSRTGDINMGPVDTSTVWMNFNGACANTDDGDATIRYDHIAKRWVVAQFSVDQSAGPFYQCIAVSTTDDPTGTYARYQFSYDAFDDYPKVALWPDAYYFTFNMFPDSGFAGGKICAMDRTKMLAGDATATMQCFDAGVNFGGLLASDVDGKSLPAAGTPNYVVALDSNTAHAYWQLHVDFATPANSTFTGPTSIAVSSYSPLCGGGTCVKQPGGGQLDSLADRAMNRFVYRRFADHESLLLTHSVVAGAGGGVRWYEIRTPATPTVFQQGTFAPDGAFRWMPSMTMDGAGDIAAIYTVSSAAVSPSIRYTARVPGDPAGTMGQGEGTVVAGSTSQTSSITRWGDYSSLNIDPVDDCTFWGTHEYEDNAGGWSTRVAAFRLPACSSFDVTADAEEVHQSATATYSVNTATTAGSPQMVTLAASGLPTGVTASFSPTSVMSGTPTMVTLTADATAMLGMTHYTVTGTGASASAMVDVQLTVDPTEMADAGGGGGDDSGKAGGGCCSSSRGTAPYGSMLLGAAVLFGVRRRRRR